MYKVEYPLFGKEDMTLMFWRPQIISKVYMDMHICEWMRLQFGPCLSFHLYFLLLSIISDDICGSYVRSPTYTYFIRLRRDRNKKVWKLKDVLLNDQGKNS